MTNRRGRPKKSNEDIVRVMMRSRHFVNGWGGECECAEVSDILLEYVGETIDEIRNTRTSYLYSNSEIARLATLLRWQVPIIRVEGLGEIVRRVTSMKRGTYEHIISLYGVEEGEKRWDESGRNKSLALLGVPKNSDSRIVDSLIERIGTEFEAGRYYSELMEVVKQHYRNGVELRSLTSPMRDLISRRMREGGGSAKTLLADYNEYINADYRDSLLIRYGDEWEDEFRRRHPPTKNMVAYWEKLGYCFESATAKVSEFQSRVSMMRQYDTSSSRTVEYWESIGYTPEDATKRVSEIQSRGREFFIGKYGKDGNTKYEQMIAARVESWNQIPRDEWDRISKSKGRTREQLIELMGEDGANELIMSRCVNLPTSRIANEFFDELEKNRIDGLGQSNYGGRSGDSEWMGVLDGTIVSVDYKVQDKIIEYYGDFWHGNPDIYSGDDVNAVTGELYREVWEMDEMRIDRLIAAGYDVMIIWESDANASIAREINKCVEWLNE